jgi:hypothetical protein
MATFVQTNVKCYVGAYDLSSNFKANELTIACEPQDDTAWGDTTRSNAGGLFNVSFSGEGFAESDGSTKPGDVFATGLGLADRLLTFAPTGGADGEVAYSFGSLQTAHQPFGGSVGDIAMFTVAGQGSGGLWVRGLVDHAKAARTTSGNGTGRQLGAVGATQKLYSALHVFAASGTTPTLDVVIQSDDNSGFTTPTTQITHTQATTITSQMLTLDGAIADDWFRVNYTIGGTTPSFTFAVVIGVR